MSSAFPSDANSGSEHSLSTLRAAVEYPLRALGFWAAVVIPFVLLALVAAGVAQQSPLLLSALVGANVAGLLLGKGHNR